MEYFDIYNRFGEKMGEVIERGEPLVVKFVSYEAFKQIVIKKDPTFWHHESAYKMLLIALEELEVSFK
ncbi:MAG: hypothetical protein LCH34_13485 [Firmicutes bacterium]|nr:hypothetical protein [Bacillota bacterium]